MKKSLLSLIIIFSGILSFAQHPTNLISSNITSNSADLDWDDAVCSGNVNFKYRVTGSGSNWIQTNNVTSIYSLSGLSPNTSYDWTVKCVGNSGWANNATFITSNNCNLTSSVSVTDASCNNTLDGSATLSVSNGFSPYIFNWDNGTTTQNLNGVSSGTYVVQISDNSGCTTSDTAIIGSIGTQSINQQLTQFSPNPITAYHQWSYDTLRITNTGCDVRIRPEFTINCSNGPIQQGDIVLKWQNPLGFNQNINYNIDANGNAYGFWSFTSGDSSGTDVTFGQIQDVVIQVKFVNPAQFGTYSATWETYKVDNLGNKLGLLAGPNTVSLTLIDCSSLTIDGFSSTNPNCVGGTDGTININNISNGSGNFSFNWSNGSSQANISGLSAGTYTLTVTDNNTGCIAVDSVTITDPSPLSGTLTGTNITCNGLSDGTLSAIASGGSSVYKYTWNPSIGQNANINNLSAGTYDLTIIDLVCNNNISGLSFTITEPDLLTSTSFNSNNTSCDTSICNGTFGIILSGGTTPYTYTWTNGDTVNSQSNLCAGSFSITATDANSCNIFTENVIVYDSSFTPSTLLTSTNISCFGLNDGNAEAIISSGSNTSGGNISTLAYCSSSPGSNLYNTIDVVNLNGDGDAINNNTSGSCDTYEDYSSQYTTLSPGTTYTLSIDLGTCNSGNFFYPDSTGVFIDWNIDGDFDDINEKIGVFYSDIPTTHNINITVPNIAYGPTRMRIVSQIQSTNPSFPSSPVNPCLVGTYGQNGTYIQPWFGTTEDYSLVINGTIPATYLWNTGDTTSSISNLIAGTYYCEVTDTNNCTSIDTVTIVEPSLISSSENITNVSCNGLLDGSAILTISGGTPGYTADWGTNNPNALSAGTYNYSITDTNGCNYNDSITITEPNELSINSITTNVLCNGDTTGSIDITISGGVSSYSFLWSNGITTEDLSNALAGTYYLQVTDANSCILLDTFVITEPSFITVFSTTTDATCNGFSDGSASLTISGGTPGYSEDWGTNNPNALSAGTYNYSITDNNSCVYTNSVLINEPNIISTVNFITNVSCNGLSDGSASITISGGTPGYSQDWGTNNPNSLSAGTYNYTITDTNGCNYNDSVTITEPQILNATYSKTNVSCNGFIDGSALVNITGGTTNYVLSWDTLNYPLLGGINVFSTPIGVPAGVYPFGIIDDNGCTFTDTITITEPDSISVSQTTTNVSCNGLSDGSVTLIISGGTPGYSEDWGTNNPNSLSAGTYNYTITDTNGCNYNNVVTITEPIILSSTINATDLTSCLVSNGSIDLNVSGGTSPYVYLWNNSDTTEDLTNLSAGNYSVTITDNNGCTTTNNTTVGQPSNGLSLSLSSTTYNGYEVSCNGGSNGNITTTAVGGLGSLSFVWSNGDTTQNLSNLSAGSYSVTMTDSVGCSLFDNITLNQPTEISSYFVTSDVLCNGDSTGTASVTFNGGVTDYLLSWTGYNYPLPNGLNTFITPIGVPAGIYPYSVTDNNGCMHFDTITINQPNAISSSYTITNYNGYNVSCNGANDASIDLQWTGGTSPYQNWFDGSTTTDTIQSNLSAGTYIDSLVDANGCSYSQSITINEPSALSLNLIPTNLSCYNSCDGRILTQINGGVSSYTFSWSDGSSLDSNTNLCSGMYNVTVTDDNGCIISDSIFLTQPNDIIINIDSIFDVSIYNGNDGEIYITPSGGILNYSYYWTGPNGFNSTNEDITGLQSGTYTITVTDSTNCSSSYSIYVDQLSSLSINLDTIINLSCFEECNGQILITADGGDSVYTYLWIGPNGFSSTDEDLDSLCAGNYELILSDSTSSVSTTFTVSQPSQLQIITNADTALCYGGLAQASAFSFGGQNPYVTSWDIGSSSITTYLNAGTHYVNVIDANGCSSTDSVLIVQNDSISISSTETDISCYGLSDGSVQIDVLSGGLPPFEYSENNGQNFQTSNIFNGLSSGTSTYIVRDANGCTNSISASIAEPNELIVSLNASSASCFGECDGTASTTISGGTGTYSEDWGGLDPNNLCAGLVNVIVEDDNNCLATNSVLITEPNPVIVIISANGISLEATQGFLSYQWLDGNGSNIIGATSQSFTPNNGGIYSVEVTNQDGCVGVSNSINFVIESVNSENNIFTIYPNPTSDWITLETNTNIDSDIKIINIFGEIIYTISSNDLLDNFEKINLGKISKGMYIVQLINNNTIINRRIIVQ
tara:strand:- start:2493 stop:9086 length:6594 start_codon:yes stop_codon:yes gene_type:complete